MTFGYIANYSFYIVSYMHCCSINWFKQLHSGLILDNNDHDMYNNDIKTWAGLVTNSVQLQTVHKV